MLQPDTGKFWPGMTGSLQAPNWTPDGKTLIYNASGKLYNFDLSTRKSTVLNTDFANKNNNDHVLTFDGKQIGISHQPEETKGQSVVYTVPVTGGVPKRITDKSPSYFHGWSPDNQFLFTPANAMAILIFIKFRKMAEKKFS